MASNTPEKKVISELSFAKHQYNQSLKSYKHILSEFQKGLNAALKLEGNTPIFLDTNVLLNFYEVSFKSREKIQDFVKNFSKRIILTNQVEREFLKNREKVIHGFQSNVTEQIPNGFNDVVSKLSSFKNANKSKLEDYSDLQEKLNEFEKSVNVLQQEIKDRVGDKKDSAKALLLNDPFLDVLASLKVTDQLNEADITVIKADYEKLISIYKSTLNDRKENSDTVSVKENFSMVAFPGCGEKSNKDDPTGDFIIFHELMHYAEKNRTDIIFITYDTKKGDWLRKDGTTHYHYLENFYHNTGKIIFIIDAERLFKDLFDTVFESLIALPENNETDITVKSLQTFLLNYEPFQKSKFPNKTINVNSNHVQELYLNGYSTIEVLKKELDSLNFLSDDVFELKPVLNLIGQMRSLLKIKNKNYLNFTNEGKLINNTKDYDKLRDEYGWILF